MNRIDSFRNEELIFRAFLSNAINEATDEYKAAIDEMNQAQPLIESAIKQLMIRFRV